jgi:hypothetical protein
MAWVKPSIDDFKTYFYRDFPYGTDLNTSVLDQDITKAFVLVDLNLPNQFWATQGAYDVAYNSLAAHYLTLNLRASSQGINGQFNWLEQSKGVGAVNSAFAIPQRILDNPLFAILTKTNYGLAYLQMLLPYLAGASFIAPGSTRP